jgi:hypothetical protein
MCYEYKCISGNRQVQSSIESGRNTNERIHGSGKRTYVTARRAPDGSTGRSEVVFARVDNQGMGDAKTPRLCSAGPGDPDFEQGT